MPEKTEEKELTAAESAHPHRRPRTLGPGTHTIHLQVDAYKRHFTVHVPPQAPSAASLPVVLFLHGGGGHAQASIRETGWTAKADKEGFLVAFLDGIPFDPSQPASFRDNPRLWNDGYKSRFAERAYADDVKYVSAVLDDLQARFPVDIHRVFASGFSNGAGMTFRLGVELSHRIAAIACIAAYFFLPDPKPQRPVPLIYIIGTGDPMVPPLGGVSASPWGDVYDKPPVRPSVERYAALLGCPPEPKTLRDENGVRVEVYGPGNDGAEAIFITVEGMGHLWPGGKNALPEKIVGKPTDKIVANDIIWEFFINHPLR